MTLPARLSAAFLDQALSCEALGSPLTARVLRALAGGWAPPEILARRLADWPGDVTSKGASVGLRLTGALHALVRAGRAPALAAIYADPPKVEDADLSAALAGVMQAQEAFVLGFLDHAPQTNEVRRSAALIAGAHWLARHHRLPLVLSELGCSAGANLIWDHYALDLPGGRLGAEEAALVFKPDWAGASLPPGEHPPVLARAGVDLNPLDPVADRERLLSYIWADQRDRIARTGAAFDLLAALKPPIARADAVDWLEGRLAEPHPGALHLIFHTVAWQYFPDAAKVRGEALLAAAGARATADAPLARLSMEADGGSRGAALTVDIWPGGQRIVLGRVDFHGRWIDWRAPRG